MDFSPYDGIDRKDLGTMVELGLRGICFLLLGGGGLWFVSALTARLFPNASPWVRLGARITLAYATALTLGAWLLLVGGFRLPWALVSVGGLVIASFLWASPKATGGLLRSDLVELGSCFRAVFPSVGWLLVPCVFLLVSAVRVLLLPPIGWDTFTYHGVKAAFFLQSGSLFLPDIAGPWSVYKHYFPGNEILQAWMLLPFHSDLLLNALDIVQLFTLLFFLLAFAVRIGLAPRLSTLLLVYFSSIPSVWRALGAGYVEYALHACLVAGVFWLYLLWFDDSAEDRRSYLFLAWIAFGSALCIKITASTVILAALFTSFFWLFASSKGSFFWRFRTLALAGAFVFLINLPWMIQHTQETGAPLSPYPLKVAGLTLGKGHPLLAWARDTIGRPPLRAEIKNLSMLFGFQRSSYLPDMSLFVASRHPHLSLFTALFLLLFLGFLGWNFRLSPRTTVFFLLFFAPLVILYASDSFRVTREIASISNGRFLWLSIVLALLLLFQALHSLPKAAKALSSFVLFAAWLNWLTTFPYSWGDHEIGPLLLALAFFGLLAVLLWNLRNLRAWQILVAWVAFFGGLSALDAYKTQTRLLSWEKSNTFHFLFHRDFWFGIASHLHPLPPQTIAVTTGPYPSSDQQMFYPLLGPRLQNRLVYLSPLPSGHIPLLDHSYPQSRRQMSFEHWYHRLLPIRPSFVASYIGPSQELEWMEQRPDLFPRIFGEDRRWGFFSFRPPPSSTPTSLPPSP